MYLPRQLVLLLASFPCFSLDIIKELPAIPKVQIGREPGIAKEAALKYGYSGAHERAVAAIQREVDSILLP